MDLDLYYKLLEIERKVDILLSVLPPRLCEKDQTHAHGYDPSYYPMLRADQEPWPTCYVYDPRTGGDIRIIDLRERQRLEAMVTQ